MNPKIKNILFFLMCFTLIFNNIPKPISQGFLGGPVGSKLIWYPLVAGVVYTAYCEWKYKNVLVNKSEVLKYLGVCLCVTFLSLAVGLFNFPYYDAIMQGPSDQVEKIPRLLTFLNNHGLDITYKQLLGFWMLARPIKGLFFNTFYTIGTTYLIYCWYHNDWREAFKVIGEAVFCSFTVIIIYSSVELFFLAGSKLATDFLALINPYIIVIKGNDMWWPPLLWKGQLRSVFAEPSYFGMYTAFSLPFLWYLMIKKSGKFYLPITCVMTFLLFLTKARTGFMLHIGELTVLTGLVIFVLRERYYLKWLGIIMLCSGLAFVGSNLFIANFMNYTNNSVDDISITESMTAYIDSNATSLANPDRRSNRARYSVMEADFKIGLDHPLLGVGMGLRNAYIPDYFSEKALENSEVKMWLNFREKLGIMKHGFPSLGEYTSKFAETGLLGLLVFLFPPFYLVVNMFKKISGIGIEERLPYIIFLTSLAGIMAAGIGDGINITWCYWVLLGLGYAMCFGKDSMEQRDNS